MTIQERDERLFNIDRGYHLRAQNYEQKLNDIKQRAQEKQAKGEDIQADIDEYKEVKGLYDRNVIEWKENRQKVYDEYGKDHEVEKDKYYEEEKEM